jgi:hypothetical protein
MANIAEHIVFNGQANEPERVEDEIVCYECTQCFNACNQCLIDVCPQCGGVLKERALRPGELLDTPENQCCRNVTKNDETAFQYESKLA